MIALASGSTSGQSGAVTLRWRLAKADQPWGDYGDLLTYGMTAHLSRNEAGELQLEHTAPFMPAFFLTGISDVVMTDVVRNDLAASGLIGYELRRVQLARIVHLDWRSWDLGADDPVEYPASGEPEDYILDRPHDEHLAASVGQIWELVTTPSRDTSDVDFANALPKRRYQLVSDQAAEWIRARFSDWVDLLSWTPDD